MLARDSSRLSCIGIVLVSLLLVVTLASAYGFSGSSETHSLSAKLDTVSTVSFSTSDYSRSAGGFLPVARYDQSSSSAFDIFGRFGVLDFNFKPVVDSIVVSPSTVVSYNAINVTASGSDGNNHSLTFHYNWFVDGVSMSLFSMPMDYDAQDYSGYENNATINGPYFNGTGGVSGGAFNFGGTDNLTIPYSAEFSFPDDQSKTICAWMSTTDTSGRIISSVPSGATPNQWGLSFVGSNPTFFAGTSGQSADTITGGTTISVGTNYFLCGIIDRTDDELRLFVNGVQDATPVSFTQGSLVTNVEVVIGDTHTGMIDEVTIYNRSLTADQMLSIYNGGTPRYNVTVQNETLFGEAWFVNTWPIDLIGLNGSELQSNVINIMSPQECPVVSTSGLTVANGPMIGSPNAVSGGEACVAITANHVIFDCGNYTVTGNETTGTHFGFHVTGDNVTIQNCPAISNYTIGVDASGYENLTVSDFSVYNTSLYGIDFTDGNRITLRNGSIMNTSNYAFYSVNSNNTRVLNTTFIGVPDGITFSGQNGFEVSHSWFDNVTGSGIRVFTGVGNGSVSHTTFRYQEDYAVRGATGIENFTFFNNTLAHNNTLVNVAGDNQTFINNSYEHGQSNTAPIYIEDATNVLAEGNYFFNMTQVAAVEVRYSTQVTVRDNTFINGSHNLVSLTAVTSADVYNNYAEGIIAVITIGVGTNHSHFWNNTGFNGTGDGMTFSTETTNNTVENNSFSFNDAGIRVRGENHTIIGNRIFNNSKDFPRVAIRNSEGKGVLFENNLMVNHSGVTIRDDSTDNNLNRFAYSNEYVRIEWTNTSSGSFLRSLNITGDLGNGTNPYMGQNVTSFVPSYFGTPHPINGTANITMYGLNSPVAPLIYRFDNYTTSAEDVIANGSVCTDCNVISYSSGTLQFNVTGFSSYAALGVAANSLPTLDNLSLNATTFQNLTTDNLTLHFDQVDADGDSLTNVTNWIVNDTSLMVLNMPFEGGSSTTETKDYSGYHHNGTVQNDPIYNGSGGYDGYGHYEFDGVDQRIIVDYTPALNLSGEQGFTVAAYVRPKTLPGDDGDIIHHYSSTGDNRGWGLQIRNNVARLAACSDGTIGSCVYAAGTTNVNQEGEWVHLVGRWDGTTAQIFVNGVPEDLTPPAISTIYDSSTTDIRIAMSATGQGYFNGSIDNVQIWNRSLSDEQIALLARNLSHIIVHNETNNAENWSACVTPNDGSADGETVCSNNVTIGENSPPTAPVLDMPNDGNNTLFNRTVFFNWTPSTDAEGDPITYTINIFLSECAIPLTCDVTNIVATTEAANYTPNVSFDVDSVYNWTVNASDGESVTPAIETFNFTVPSTIFLNLTRNSTNFGTLQLQSLENTSDDEPLPMVVENAGNVFVNITIYAQEALWDSGNAPLGSSNYFQAKADFNSTENNSFNFTESNTTWFNINGTGSAAAEHLIGKLNYSDTNDTAEIDFQIRVPFDEPSGSKTSTIVLTGAIAEP